MVFKISAFKCGAATFFPPSLCSRQFANFVNCTSLVWVQGLYFIVAIDNKQITASTTNTTKSSSTRHDKQICTNIYIDTYRQVSISGSDLINPSQIDCIRIWTRGLLTSSAATGSRSYLATNIKCQKFNIEPTFRPHKYEYLHTNRSSVVDKLLISLVFGLQQDALVHRS